MLTIIKVKKYTIDKKLMTTRDSRLHENDMFYDKKVITIYKSNNYL